MPLAAGSMRDFFEFRIQPRTVAAECSISPNRLGALRRCLYRPTANDVVQLAFAFNETYDAVLNEFDALDSRHIAFLRRQLAEREDEIPQDANA